MKKTRKIVDRASGNMSTWRRLSCDVVQLPQVGCKCGSKSHRSQRQEKERKKKIFLILKTTEKKESGRRNTSVSQEKTCLSKAEPGGR